MGLPEQLSQSKVNDFQYVIEQVKSQLKPWYNQFLSQAGKEVISVLQAKSVFSMSCFLLPKTTCDEINSLLSEFWWGRNDGKRKISWVSWSKLCLPKSEGGMSFRDLLAFNKALLGKQVWRILQNPNSLISRLYRGRYHWSTAFLQSSSSTHASYGWKSNHVGKELLKKGITTLIGDGKLTNVWLDQWVPELPPRTLGYTSKDPEMKVSDLICQDTKTSNVPVLEQVLDPSVVEQVHDILVWSYSRNMKYSVKSGYWAATHDLREGNLIEPPLGSVDLKKQCWKINIIPKIKAFIWKVLSGALSTYVQLCTRGINVDPTCQRCCLAEETINYVLFQCPHAFAIWRCSNLPIENMFTQDLEENIQTLLQFGETHKDDTKIGLMPFWMIWFVWKARNEFLFNKRNVQPIEDWRRAWNSNEE